MPGTPRVARNGNRPTNYSLLSELRELIGDPAALALIEAFGGTMRYIPKVPEPGQAIVKAVGMDAAQRLARYYGANELPVPLAKQWRALAYIDRDDASYGDIAPRLCMTTSGVSRLVGRPANAPPFDPDRPPADPI